MNYTEKQIEKMADEYANQFMDGKDHLYGFKAGFEKALSLFAVSKCEAFEREALLLAYGKFLSEECTLISPDMENHKPYIRKFLSQQ
jgi:hypothetical protein